MIMSYCMSYFAFVNVYYSVSCQGNRKCSLGTNVADQADRAIVFSVLSWFSVLVDSHSHYYVLFLLQLTCANLSRLRANLLSLDERLADAETTCEAGRAVLLSGLSYQYYQTATSIIMSYFGLVNMCHFVSSQGNGKCFLWTNKCMLIGDCGAGRAAQQSLVHFGNLL